MQAPFAQIVYNNDYTPVMKKHTITFALELRVKQARKERDAYIFYIVLKIGIR